MIKFFQKIRQKLLAQGETGRYAQYAIGEIFLVVIGILIALQINNWNEHKKEKAFEKEILEQIRANLLNEKVTLETIKTNFEKAMLSTEKVLNANWTEEEEKDSLKYWLGNIIQFDRFQPLTNAYEVVKSKGLDLISNKQLRFQIGAYYDDQIKQIGKSIEDIEMTFHNNWSSILLKESLEVRFKEYIILKDNSILKGDTEPVNILRLNRGNFSGGHQRIIRIIEQIEQLVSTINQELEK